MTVVDAARTRTFTYNAQVALQKESISGIYTKELNRVYTTSGLKGSYSGLNIGTVNLYTYGYDRYSRLNKVTTAAGVFNYTFLADSDLIASMTRPNNVSTNYTYETARDLLTKVANGAISTFRPANGALGRRTGMNRSGSAFTAADVLSYTYNSYSELTGASSNNNASYRYSYAYDPIGNRKTAGLAGTNWTYTANNLNQYSALNQAGTVQNPTYNIDGNMLTRDGWTQTWNAENRLIKAEKGTAKLEFAYDYMGRRIEKKVYNGNTLTSHIRFVYDGYKLIEELNGLSNNAVLRRYAWQPVMLDTPLTVFDAAANKTYFYHTDANKNVTDLTDSAGAIVAHYEYSPFGQLVKSSGAYANTNVLTWSSEYTDRETGLIYYNFREYDPKLGRWLSRDPIHEQGGLNLYAYISNKTINHIDKLGLQNFGEGFLPTTIDLLPQIAEQEAARREYFQRIADFQQQFNDWYQKAYDQIYDENGNIKDDAWIHNILPCPLSISFEDRQFGNPYAGYYFKKVPVYDTDQWEMGSWFFITGSRYHPSGKYELRQKKITPEGHGNQCVYDCTGHLLINIPSAGTADFSSPAHYFDHQNNDVVPFDIILAMESYGLETQQYLKKYYKVRPIIYKTRTGEVKIIDPFVTKK